MRTNQILVWIIIFVVASLIVNALINSEFKLPDINKATTLDILNNPQDYLDKEITINDVWVVQTSCNPSYSEESILWDGVGCDYKMGKKEEDGNMVWLPISYPKPLHMLKHYDFTGNVKFNAVYNSYYFEIERAVIKD